MFSYQLPNGEPHLMVKLNRTGKVVFGTPLPQQMNTTVIAVLEDPRWSNHFKKIVDFGCGSMSLFKLLRRLECVEQILNVDVDEATLLEKKSRIDPLMSDHLRQRNRPLHAAVLKGSITDAVEILRNTDAAIVVEVIQYLEPEQLESMKANIFGFMQPKLIVVTTPNHEFNQIYDDLTNDGLRSQQHKFEWNRKEFKNWANEICNKHQNYSFAILGVGPPPPDKKLGAATQLAIFARNDIIGRDLVEPLKNDLEADKATEVQYEEIHAVDFPFFNDTLTKHDKIEGEIMNYFSTAHKVERYYNRERDIYQIPIKPLIEYANSIETAEEDVLLVLKAKKLAVENEFVLLTQEYIDDNFICRGEDDIYEGYADPDDFLDYEPYQRSFGDDDDGINELGARLSDACSVRNDDDEENWD